MVDERETVSDEQFLAEAVEAKAEPQTQEKPQDERPRDEHGRFAPKAGEEQEEQPQAAQEQPQPRQEQDHRIPLRELLDEREKRQTAERNAQEIERQFQAMQQRLAQQQRQPEQIPDLLADPEGYARFVEARIERQVEGRFIEASMQRAQRQYGEPFREAWMAVQLPGNERIREQVRFAADPGETLMDWHRRESTLREIGGDLTGYRKKLIGDESFRKEALGDETFMSAILNNPEIRRQVMEAAQAEARGETRSGVTNLRSLNSATTARRASAGDDLDDTDFLKSNTRLRR